MDRPETFFELEDDLTPAEKAVRDTVRSFAARRLRPNLAVWFEKAEFPLEIVAELGDLGLLGMTLEGYGCAGAGPVAYGLACQELEAADTAFRSFVSVQGSLAMFAIHTYGSEEQRQQWLPAMAAGSAVGCFGLTEPDHGSDPAHMRTTARRDGDDWLLNGTKTWITNGSMADVAIVWARAETGIQGFLVPTRSPGFSATAIERKTSLRASVTAELVMADCRVRGDAALPGATGLRAALSCLDEARYGIAWGAIGAAQDCFECALAYSRARNQFGRPIGSFQLTQRKLVEMFLEIEKARLVALRVGRLKQAGRATGQHVSFAKLNNVREALRVAREARSILGANGITLDYPIARHMNNLESVLTYEGTEEIHTLVLGEALTGHAAFS